MCVRWIDFFCALVLLIYLERFSADFNAGNEDMIGIMDSIGMVAVRGLGDVDVGMSVMYTTII